MGDPSIDDLVRRVVVAKGLEQYLSSAIELTAEDAVRTMGFVECSTAVLDRCPEMLASVLVLEVFEAVAFRAREQEADHHVVEAAIDEVVDDRSKLWLPTELFKQAHLPDHPDAM